VVVPVIGTGVRRANAHEKESLKASLFPYEIRLPAAKSSIQNCVGWGCLGQPRISVNDLEKIRVLSSRLVNPKKLQRTQNLRALQWAQETTVSVIKDCRFRPPAKLGFSQKEASRHRIRASNEAESHVQKTGLSLHVPFVNEIRAGKVLRERPIHIDLVAISEQLVTVGLQHTVVTELPAEPKLFVKEQGVGNQYVVFKVTKIVELVDEALHFEMAGKPELLRRGIDNVMMSLRRQ
jgi:hypothetical protein